MYYLKGFNGLSLVFVSAAGFSEMFTLQTFLIQRIPDKNNGIVAGGVQKYKGQKVDDMEQLILLFEAYYVYCQCMHIAG